MSDDDADDDGDGNDLKVHPGVCPSGGEVLLSRKICFFVLDLDSHSKLMDDLGVNFSICFIYLSVRNNNGTVTFTIRNLLLAD